MAHKTQAGLGLLVVGAVVAFATLRGSAGPPVRRSAPAGRAAETARIREADIRFYHDRAARDPDGARDRAALAALYLARGRATGDASDFARAESLATASLTARHSRNGSAAQVLVGALMAEHRFAQAWRVMLPEVVADPEDGVARATLGEIALELGRYPAADSLFGALTVGRTRPAIAPRYARWLELNGRSGEARELLIATRRHLEHGFQVPDEQLAWFDLRIGELAFRNGRVDLAEAAYDRGLSLVPEDPRLLAARARLAAAEGAWDSAIALGERTLDRTLDPATLGLLSDAYAALGSQARADEYARAMEVSVSRQPGAYHRGWALFLLDHHRQVDLVLSKARAELEVRKDVYGYDVLAWALHQAGRDREALPLADSALSRGTRDAMLHYHRGLIALGLADTIRARADLALALAINPAYRSERGPAAGALLTSLERR